MSERSKGRGGGKKGGRGVGGAAAKMSNRQIAAAAKAAIKSTASGTKLSDRFSNIGKKPQQNQRVKQQRGQSKPEVRAQPQQRQHDGQKAALAALSTLLKGSKGGRNAGGRASQQAAALKLVTQILKKGSTTAPKNRPAAAKPRATARGAGRAPAARAPAGRGAGRAAPTGRGRGKGAAKKLQASAARQSKPSITGRKGTATAGKKSGKGAVAGKKGAAATGRKGAGKASQGKARVNQAVGGAKKSKAKVTAAKAKGGRGAAAKPKPKPKPAPKPTLEGLDQQMSGYFAKTTGGLNRQMDEYWASKEDAAAAPAAAPAAEAMTN